MSRGKRVGSTLPKRDSNVIFTRRAALMSFVGAGVMGAILFRMAQLQATNLISREYTAAADDNRFDTRIIAPPRGVIYDRFGVVLAQTSKDYQVSVIQNDVEDMEDVVGRVAQILGLNAEWARRAIIRVRSGSRYEPQPLKEGLTWEEFNAINVRLPELRGIVANSADVRAYPFDVVYAHPIGYVQKPTQHDLERAIEEDPVGGQSRSVYLRNPHVRVGKAGLEASMETVLHGEAGWRKVIVNARGVEQGEDESERREPVRGSGVVLTIDHELQRTAMQSFGDQAGSAVVMDIFNGDILVMASTPTFDPNQFVNGIAQAPFAVLNEDEKKPLFNKAISGGYPPGSTFKLMVGIAAKQAGVEDDWHINCPGYFPFGGRNFHCWKRGGHGRINMNRAIKESCDVFFYQAALRAGPERIATTAREFGFGLAHDVSLPNVQRGLVPDPEWWLANRHERWTAGLTVNYGIGQGSLVVTPLQLATMAARIANNGRAVLPRLVREAPGVTDPPTPAILPDISPEHLLAIRQGMFGVANEGGGTATRAGNMIQCVRRPDGVIIDAAGAPPGCTPVQIAGKTGTAQARVITAAERAGGVRHDSELPWRLRDHALFVSFGPYDNPRYAAAVVMEHGGHLNYQLDASPITAMILRQAFLRDTANRPPARLAQLEAGTRA
ncbi:penicillin-binding protein 2 [Terricaulis silvestris]|uniref:Sporulation-specific penicillin-binding protein n=1 Tax=Terricaulis silvestris TaxID=2686094 RepID=A0A6I6MSV9_9CAUL|nr:penicillin-binding protein 2 [Terricaulis silvestris]QGZ95867.1 Sporulation-specific penicillin-binding protein [Terricaulis silvestris]